MNINSLFMMVKKSNGWIKFCNSKYRMKNKTNPQYSLSDAMAQFKAEWHAMSPDQKNKWKS